MSVMDRGVASLGQLANSRTIEVVVLSSLAAICALATCQSGYSLISREQFLPCLKEEEENACDPAGNDALQAQGLPVTWFLLLLVVSRVVFFMAAQVQLFVSYKFFARLGFGFTLIGIVAFCLVMTAVFSLAIFTPASFSGIEVVLYLVVRRATKWCHILLSSLHQSPYSTDAAESAESWLVRSMSVSGAKVLLSTVRTCLIIGLGIYTVEPFSSLCLLACVSALVVVAVFFLVFPACLALGKQLSPSPLLPPSARIPPVGSARGPPARPAYDGVSHIQTVMMLGLAIVHVRRLLGSGAGGGEAFVDGGDAPDTRLLVLLLRQNRWWNYLCCFGHWCGGVLLICVFRDATASELLCSYFGLHWERRVSFLEQVAVRTSSSVPAQARLVREAHSLPGPVHQQVPALSDAAEATGQPARDCPDVAEAIRNPSRDSPDSTAAGAVPGVGAPVELSPPAAPHEHTTPQSEDSTDRPSVAEQCTVDAADNLPDVFPSGENLRAMGSSGDELYVPSLADACTDSAHHASLAPRDGSQCPDEGASITRSFEQCCTVLEEGEISSLTDDEILLLLRRGKMSARRLEKFFPDDLSRAVCLRRKLLSADVFASADSTAGALRELPFTSYKYSEVFGCCCENVLGYVPVPVGVVGPLLLDGKEHHVPLATTEGCLVASTNRGCSALLKSGGVHSAVLSDGMSRAPVVRFPSVLDASAAKKWCEDSGNFACLQDAFNLTSRFARLQSVHCVLAGNRLHLRFTATTGDAMGMNMLSKGVDQCVRHLCTVFPRMEVVSLSGNFCTDKKPSAVNWILGRGKSVVCEATLPASVVAQVLKTTPEKLARLNYDKNLVGSAMAGSLGGYNAHAANVVTAIFIATGQDVAQSGTSSACITQLEVCAAPEDGGESSLHVTCSMPCLETGTVGGGTNLSAQQACLKMLGVNGPNMEEPGQNSAQLARVICGTVMAGELSLMAALVTGDLVTSHLRHNRSLSSLHSQPSSDRGETVLAATSSP